MQTYTTKMRKRLALVGEQQGAITVLAYAGGNKSVSRYLCHCGACGDFFTLDRPKLLRGRNKSCGCQHTQWNLKDRNRAMIGQRYHRLTVLSDTAIIRFRETQVLCVCDCGNFCLRSAPQLRHGDQKSCGCMIYERWANAKRPRRRKLKSRVYGNPTPRYDASALAACF